MSTLPPPTPPTPHFAVAGRPKPPAKTIGIFAAVAVIAAGGTFLVTRGDDPQTVAPATTTTTTVAVTVPQTTTAPVIVEPTTTLETLPETTVPATVAIPDGASELGYGVYIVAGDDVEVSGDGPFTLDNGTGVRAIVQVLNRDYSEDPNDVMQEYIAQWDGDYAQVAYSASTVYEPGYHGFDTLRFAKVAYAILNSDGPTNTAGIVWAVVRSDGLTILGDTYGANSNDGPLAAGWDGMVASLAAAPPVGDPADFALARSVLVPNQRPSVDLPFECNCQVVLPDGFSVAADDGTIVSVADAGSIITFVRLEGVTSPEAAVQAAQQAMQTKVTIATISNESMQDRDLDTQFFEWNGTSGGVSAFGAVWVMYDPTQEAALVAYSFHADDWNNQTDVEFLIEGFAWNQPTIN